ncbi:otogelin [Osmerus mordax]|uniref:otogelin n=1 Tax=Osmerus mordax TaxID=8014 RepID=UPI0035101158
MVELHKGGVGHGSTPGSLQGDLLNALFSQKQQYNAAEMGYRFPKRADPCLFPCLNGGQCVHPETCDCSLYQATGTRCQTVPNAGFEREMTCRAWGQYNFETFDGLYYFYPGKCTYTLLRDCEDTTQSNVVIQVHNDPGCQSSPYTCTRSISLFLPWEGEVRLHRTNVTFKGQRLQLPYHIHDIELEYISQYVLVTQQQGFTLAWDGHSGSVYIKLSPEYVGRTCGMCGNFNADVQDDLKTSYDVLTQDLAMFGNSWVEEEPHQARCAPVPSMFLSPCASQDSHTMLKVEEVCAMLLEEPFKTCHEFVSPMSYMSSCSNDLCQSGPNGDVVCQVFTEYARACAHADHPLHRWRAHIPQCAVQCSPELQYKECITCCPVSCNMDRMCIDSKLPCLDGCYCPDDLIYEDGSCVKPSDCPCEYHGMVYPSGQTVQEECNNCTCMGGVWNCTDHSCPGECSVTGDMYFQSFDGRTYSFPASCQYVLAKSRNSGKFTVTIQNAPCGPNLDGACIQSVSLVIDEDPRTEITMSHLGEVFMAGQYRISLPYSDDVFHIQELSSMFLQVRTSPGLRLQYGWREFRLYLQVDELWKEDTVGLCGTFNGNIQDDFLSPSGMIESTPLLFGNAWRVSSACAPIHSLPQLDPCDTHQQTASYATEMCDVLNQELFATCHEYLSPIPFHRQCRADTCKCGAPCLCSALAHYARHCRKYHIIVRFRAHVPDCAIQCPETMEYGTCVSSCQRRCSALAVPQHCGQECEEGCVCPEGTFYSTRTHTCVPRSECPCSFLGADYAPGDVIMTSAGVQVCQDGKLMLQSSESDKLCPLGQMYLDCSEGMDRGLACEQTCESFLLNLTCSTHEPCVPGCVCPPGMLKHGDECFEPDACPCLWKGKEYYPGDRVISPCYQCICQHGTFQCVFRPCPSMCTAYGDRHYRTFDGLLFDYVGACKVYLVKSTAEVMLSVSAENVDCFDSGIICRKSLVINIGRSFIAFDDESGKPNPSSVIDRKQSVFIWHAGYFTMVHVPEEDLTVLWDRKTTVHIQAGPRWQGKLSGLCGNFDLKTVNEMRTPENIDSPTAQEFGNSWTAAECVNSPDIRHPCSLSPLREPFAKRKCGVLLSEVFQLCHPVVDVTWFYMNCLSDTCGCSRGGDCECFCTSVAAYAHRCCHQGITIDWRSPSMCPFDCEFYNKVLGKGPYMLLTYLERNTVLAANRSSGMVFPKKLTSMGPGILSVFMVTPGLSRSRPHDTSLVSLEVSERPNYFLHVDQDGRLRVTKWEESEAFWDQATFILHRDTWITGYDSLESFTKTGFFLHYMLSWVHLMKYKHTDSFRKATLFKLTGPAPDIPTGPRCQWRYDSCVSPCFKTCSDPSGGACVTIPKVEGCLPMCPAHMVLDEVTQRCVHVEDCIKPPVAVQPITTTAVSVETTPAAVIPITATTTPASPSLSTEHSTPSPTPGPLTTASTPIPITTSGMALSTAATTTVRFTTATSAVYTQTTTISVPTTVPEKVVLPDSTSSIPAPVSHVSTVASLSPPTLPPTVSPEGVKPVSTVKTTTAPTTVPIVTTEQITSAPSSTLESTDISTVRTTLSPFPVSTLLTSSTSPTASQETLYTTSTTTSPPSTVMVQPMSSTEGPTLISTLPSVTVSPPRDTTKATTRLVDLSPISTTSSLRPTEVSDALRDTVRTTLPIATTGVYNETSTKLVFTVETGKTPTTESLPPGVTSTVATTEYHTSTSSDRKSESVHNSHNISTFNQVSFTVHNFHYSSKTNHSPREGHYKSHLYYQDYNGTNNKNFPGNDNQDNFQGSRHNTGHPYIFKNRKVYCQDNYRQGLFDYKVSRRTNKFNHTWPTYGTSNLTTVTASTAVPIGVTTKPSTPTQIHITSTESSKTPPYDNQTFTAGVTTTEVTPEGTTTSTILTLSPTATPSYTPEPEKVETTPAELSPTPAPESPYTTVKTTLAANITTSMVVSSTRVCTPPYAEFIDECTKYICVNGQLVLFNKSQNCPYSSTPPNCGLLGFAILVNGDKCCPQWDCPCRCSVFPDLNVITFDGNSVAIYKAASYIVTQLPNETVSMLVQECPSSDSDTLLWNFTNLCLVALNITHQSNHVIINRLQRRLYVNSRYAKPRFKKFGFEILDTGNMYLIRTPAGLRLQWFHSTGMMVIETESYNNKLLTMGLCGCCDGNPANDLMLSNGTTVGESEDPGVFIDSWQVPNTTSYISPSRRREVNCSTSDCSQCLSMLNNHSFMSCHAFVPPSTFCEMWVRDAEYVNNPCVALAAYVASCHKFNVCIEWRSPDYCPFICSEDLRYQACLPACTAQTCSNHDFDYDPEQCSGLTEGCVCPAGTLLHRPYSALCIPPEKCACTDSSGLPRGHGEVWKASKDGCCMYRCDNDSIVPVEYNCSTVPSPLCRRTGEMVISLADDTSCCPQKACICNQSLCEVFPLECKYGEKLVSYFREDSCCPEYVCECDPEFCELDLPTCREDQTLIATKTEGSCCLAHICMCGACTEIIPECQDGEVLTVDANSTDRCCPIYHCVCEPYRCPDTTCPLGMSPVIVSSPNQCCPMHTCECACDKILRPKCVMGETMQLDRAFQTDPVNQCACKRYNCVREAVCVDGERGVMRPGQTLVEHSEDGVCHTAQCTRGLDTSTGYHRIRTTSTNCSALCQLNQIYIPPKDQTTCCGVCKNISCLYQNENGTSVLYKPGKSWVSNCVKHDCTDTLSGPTLVTYSYSCPPFNETECMKIGGTIVSYMDGCCKTCKEDGKSCQKVTVRMTIRKNDCRSNRPVNIVSCDGKCPSASIYNYNINTYARFCKCCREMGLQRRSVQLYCNGNSTWVSYSIQEPTDCSCQWS